MNQLPVSDTDLISEVLSGRSQAYTQLLLRYQHMVYTLAIRMLRDRELAEETTQDIFVKAYRSLGNFKGDSRFSTWLYKIAYHHALDIYARQTRLKKYKSSLSVDHLGEGGTDPTWSGLLNRERKEVLISALDQLSARENSLISLFYLQEMSLKEISQITGMKPPTVKVGLFRARERLKKMLSGSETGSLLQQYER